MALLEEKCRPWLMIDFITNHHNGNADTAWLNKEKPSAMTDVFIMITNHHDADISRLEEKSGMTHN